jgi:thioredoxin reductase
MLAEIHFDVPPLTLEEIGYILGALVIILPFLWWAVTKIFVTHRHHREAHEAIEKNLAERHEKINTVLDAHLTRIEGCEKTSEVAKVANEGLLRSIDGLSNTLSRTNQALSDNTKVTNDLSTKMAVFEDRQNRKAS